MSSNRKDQKLHREGGWDLSCETNQDFLKLWKWGITERASLAKVWGEWQRTHSQLPSHTRMVCTCPSISVEIASNSSWSLPHASPWLTWYIDNSSPVHTVLMDRWIDDGYIDGWMGEVNGWIDRWIEAEINRMTRRWIGGWVDGWMDESMVEGRGHERCLPSKSPPLGLSFGVLSA